MIIIYLSIAWLIGLWFADTLLGAQVSVMMWALAGFLGFVGAVFMPNDERAIKLLLGCLLTFSIGGARAASVEAVRCDEVHVCGLNGQPRDVTLVGWVAGEPDVRDEVTNLRVRVQEATVRNLAHPDGLTRAVEGDVLVSVPHFPEIAYGSVVTVTGKLSVPFESAEFSYRDYLARENIYSTMYLPRIRVGDENRGSLFLSAIYNIKNSAADTIEHIIPAPESGLLKALLLGDKSGLTEQLEENFRRVGLAHLIAISGFHVTIILMLSLSIFDAFLKPRHAIILTSFILLFYALLVGLRAPIVRATLMGVSTLIGIRFFGRRTATIPLLALVALLMTVAQPDQIYSVSFQLSFVAILSIALYFRPIFTWLNNWIANNISITATQGIGHLLIGVCAVSLAAQILTQPLVAYHFEQFPVFSIVISLFVVIVQPTLMVTGIFSVLVGMIFESLGKLLGWLSWFFLRYTIFCVEFVAVVPFAQIPVKIDEYGLVLIYALIGAVTWYLFQEVESRVEVRQRLTHNLPRPTAVGVGVLGVFFALNWSNGQPDGLLHVSFFDVGQGDAIFVETPSGVQILIDGGEVPALLSAEIGRKIPFWDREIDLVIATHPDADHVTGLPELFDRYQVQQFIYDGQTAAISGVYGALWERIEAQQIETHIAQAGEVIEVGDGVRLEIIHPNGTLDEDTRNNNSVSLRLVYGDFSLLLTGDAEIEAEQAMLKTGLPLQSVVYKAGHHGSRTSSSAEFLNAINPQIVVVSAGVDNQFGHPHEDVIGRFNALGAAVLDTRIHGTIEVKTDGEQMWWTGYRKIVSGEQ